MCEGEIRELKRGSTRKMLNHNVHKKLCDHLIDLEYRICSASTLTYFDLDHQTPEAKMHGMSSGISDICEFEFYEFYEWVIFNDSQATFPETKFHVGRWIGPAVDVGSALTYKTFKSNGQVVPRSTIRHLTLDELANPNHTAMTKAFDDNIIQKIGVPATENDFEKDYLTPKYEYYDGDHQDEASDAPPEQLTPTPEIGDNYLNMELMLPRGGTPARGRVIERKRDHGGNVIGRSNANPILDTREYEVKFEDGDVTELTANVIAESMYAMCDENSDHILLFDVIVDHKKNDKAMTRA